MLTRFAAALAATILVVIASPARAEPAPVWSIEISAAKARAAPPRAWRATARRALRVAHHRGGIRKTRQRASYWASAQTRYRHNRGRPPARPPKVVAAAGPPRIGPAVPAWPRVLPEALAALPPEPPPVEEGRELLDPRRQADEYLCDVYRRVPDKVDRSGDFTWKDRAAAARLDKTVCEYAIEGMNIALREALFTFGQIADAAGIRWSFLSGFRDDYRQRIAAGFKARGCGSMHGGSCRTGGWSDGRAADLWMYGGDGQWISNANPLFALIDRVGRRLGLARPMPGYDPAHVQVTGNWIRIGLELRRMRLAEFGIVEAEPPAVKIKIAAAKPKKKVRLARSSHRKVAHSRKGVRYAAAR